MAGLKEDDPPLTDSQKLDRILAQITTINKRLDTHDLRLSRLEKQKVEDNAEQSPEDPKTEDSGRGPRGSGRGGGGGGGPFNRHYRRDDDWRRPHRPKLSFPHYDGESDPLPWLNKYDSYFRGCRTMDEERVWLASLHLDGAATE